VLSAYYRAEERFAYPEFCSTVGSFAGLAMLFWLLPKIGVVAAAWSVVFRTAFEFALMIPGLGRYHRPDWSSPTCRTACLRAMPMLFGAFVYRSDVLIDRFLASLVPPGGLTLLAFARQLHHAGARLLNRAIALPMVPRLTTLAHQKDRRAYVRLYRRRSAMGFGLSGAAIVALWLVGEPVLGWALGGRNVGSDEIRTIWWMLLALAGIAIGEPLVNVLSNCYFALHETVAPTRIWIVSYLVGVVFRLAGFAIGGLMGNALGISGYYIVYAALLGFLAPAALNKMLSKK
jgi:putative peptidoglycan lipid II flippase